MSDTADYPRSESATADGQRGSHLAAISRRVVGLVKEQYGKGPTGARTYLSGDLVVVILSGGFTAGERTLVREGHVDAVSGMRSALQETMRPKLKQIVEEELQRPVIAFMSANHDSPDLAAEIFILASPAIADEIGEARMD